MMTKIDDIIDIIRKATLETRREEVRFVQMIIIKTSLNKHEIKNSSIIHKKRGTFVENRRTAGSLENFTGSQNAQM